MLSSAFRFLAVVALMCAVHEATGENINGHVKTWGDLSSQVTLGATKSKFGIPLVQRSLELSYPDVSFRLANCNYMARRCSSAYFVSIGLPH